jgi:hypothetical protein
MMKLSDNAVCGFSGEQARYSLWMSQTTSGTLELLVFSLWMGSMGIKNIFF